MTPQIHERTFQSVLGASIGGMVGGMIYGAGSPRIGLLVVALTGCTAIAIAPTAGRVASEWLDAEFDRARNASPPCEICGADAKLRSSSDPRYRPLHLCDDCLDTELEEFPEIREAYESGEEGSAHV